MTQSLMKKKSNLKTVSTIRQIKNKMQSLMCVRVLPLVEREVLPDPGNSSRFDGGLCSGEPAWEPASQNVNKPYTQCPQKPLLRNSKTLANTNI